MGGAGDGTVLHFLDSGSFSLLTRAKEFAAATGRSEWEFYETPEFYAYCDGYAAFVKENREAIDDYANVDAIPNPDVTWRNQRYLEREHGLSPVPVVHFDTDLRWLEHYISRGRHEMIALGGLVGAPSGPAREWLDRCFEVVCDTPDRKPCVKIHGFGMTSFPLMRRYPWWSVDSASWTKVGAYGSIMVPHRNLKGWDFTRDPYLVTVSDDSPGMETEGKHWRALAGAAREVVLEWLREIDVPFGRMEGGEVVEQGVTNHHSERKIANLLLFQRFLETVPEYPWAWQRPYKRPRMLG